MLLVPQFVQSQTPRAICEVRESNDAMEERLPPFPRIAHDEQVCSIRWVLGNSQKSAR
jgi:hypothetical protein